MSTRQDCQQIGHHQGPIVTQPPQVGEASVEVNEVCLFCGWMVATTSWTRRAWDREQAVTAKKGAVA